LTCSVFILLELSYSGGDEKIVPVG